LIDSLFLIELGHSFDFIISVIVTDILGWYLLKNKKPALSWLFVFKESYFCLAHQSGVNTLSAPPNKFTAS